MGLHSLMFAVLLVLLILGLVGYLHTRKPPYLWCLIGSGALAVLYAILAAAS
jgi:hypothetical protein